APPAASTPTWLFTVRPASRMLAFLHQPSLVGDQHAIRFANALEHAIADDVANQPPRPNNGGVRDVRTRPTCSAIYLPALRSAPDNGASRTALAISRACECLRAAPIRLFKTESSASTPEAPPTDPRP